MFKTLTIAGFDGSGGAGIQADLKTFSALGCYGMTVLTALPIQNTQGVRSIYDIPPICVQEQLTAILEDIEVDALKIGMLHREEVIQLITPLLHQYRLSKIVLDPVMIAKSGDALLHPGTIQTMVEKLFPLAMLITPNLDEASLLLEREVRTKTEMEKAAQELSEYGSQAVLVKGGHLNGDCEDCLYLKGDYHWFSHSRIETKNTHGTGCTLSAAITAFLAKDFDLLTAVQKAKEYLTKAIQSGARFKIGHGHGPVNHFHELWK